MTRLWCTTIFALVAASLLAVLAWNPRLQPKHPNSLTTPVNVHDESRKLLSGAGKAIATALLVAPLAPEIAMAADKVKKSKKPKVLETELGIKYIELQKGSGAYPNDGDYVIIDYTAFLNNGTVFDSTESKGRKPLSFRYGRKQVIPGLESVIGYMQAGGEVTCSIPSKYAYADKGVCIAGQGCIVPPNEDLKYAVKLRNVGVGFN